MQKLRGTGVALVTPFNEDLSVDFEGLSDLVNHVISGGVDYLVVMGTTAENVTLVKDEKRQVLDKVLAVNAGRLPVIYGVGGNCTSQVVADINTFDFKGVTALLSVSPYYNRPTQEGIFQHYRAVAEASPLPILLYNVPARTGSNMLPETVWRLAASCPNIIGIKEAGGSMEQVLRLLRDRPEGFLIVSGDDMIALPLVCAGGDGVISVIGQGIPKVFSTIINNGLEGKLQQAYEAHYKWMPLIDFIFEEGNPAGIKALLKQKGVANSEVRLPLVKASATLSEKIAVFLKDL